MLTATPTHASSGAIGSWAAIDIGQGGHAAGTMQQDGTLTGGGYIVVADGLERASFASGTWQFSPGTTDHVDLCLTPDPVSDPLGLGLFNQSFCFSDIPINQRTEITVAGVVTLFILNVPGP